MIDLTDVLTNLQENNLVILLLVLGVVGLIGWLTTRLVYRVFTYATDKLFVWLAKRDELMTSRLEKQTEALHKMDAALASINRTAQAIADSQITTADRLAAQQKRFTTEAMAENERLITSVDGKMETMRDTQTQMHEDVRKLAEAFVEFRALLEQHENNAAQRFQEHHARQHDVAENLTKSFGELSEQTLGLFDRIIHAQKLPTPAQEVASSDGKQEGIK